MPHQVTLLGDSIRMGYTENVRAELGDFAEVFSPTANGGTSRNVLLTLDSCVLSRQPKPDLVHVNCGLHDIMRSRSAGGILNVPQEEYEINVLQILSSIRQQTGAKVIWATITPVNEQRHSLRKGFERFERDLDAYNESGLRAARAAGVEVNDLYNVVMRAGRDRLLTEDGVHFQPEGSAILGRAVAQTVRAALGSA